MTSPAVTAAGFPAGRRPAGDSRVDREHAWYAYAHGDDGSVPPAWPAAYEDEVLAPPPPGDPGPVRPLPLGATDLLSQTPFPWSSVALPFCSSFALGHALATAFAPVRREPENPYNDHRSYPSPRCAFPVDAFLAEDGRWRPLLPGRRGIAGGSGGTPTALALTGRFEALPAEYGFFRGTLVNLELGIVLRSLAVGLSLFGVPGWLRMPGPGGTALLRRLDPAAAARRSLPAVVDLAGPTSSDPAPDLRATPLAPRPELPTDARLAAVVAADRAAAVDAPAVRLGAGIPRRMFAPLDRPSWAEVLWRRTSGEMPRGLHGMAAQPRTVPRRALTDALRWLLVPPPAPLLAAVGSSVTTTVVTGRVADTEPGVYRLTGGDLVLHRADPAAPARLEAAYGYPASPQVGCEIRHAAAIWLFSARPRPVVERHGAAGWAALQHAVGWMAQGLCLAAAGADLFARPVGAFLEDGVREVCELAADEMVILAVVTGVDRHQGGPRLDLRL